MTVDHPRSVTTKARVRSSLRSDVFQPILQLCQKKVKLKKTRMFHSVFFFRFLVQKRLKFGTMEVFWTAWLEFRKIPEKKIEKAKLFKKNLKEKKMFWLWSLNKNLLERSLIEHWKLLETIFRSIFWFQKIHPRLEHLFVKFYQSK